MSIECRKTRTKVFTLANHKRRRQSNAPIRSQSKYLQPAPGAGNVCEHVMFGLGFACDWLGKWRVIFFSQSQSVAMQNQSNREIAFRTQLKTPLVALHNVISIFVVMLPIYFLNLFTDTALRTLSSSSGLNGTSTLLYDRFFSASITVL